MDFRNCSKQGLQRVYERLATEYPTRVAENCEHARVAQLFEHQEQWPIGTIDNKAKNPTRCFTAKLLLSLQ